MSSPARPRSTRVRSCRRRALLLLLACAATPVSAQHPHRAANVAVVPPEHWLHDVVLRIHAAGLAPRAFDPAAGTITIADAAGMLNEAARAAESRDHPLQLLTLAWLERLRAEYPVLFDDAHRTVHPRLRAAIGLTAHQNPVLPRPDTSLPRLEADTFSAFAALHLAGALLGRVQLELDAVANAAGVQLREAYATGIVGPIGIWGGARRLGFSTTRSGGMVVNPSLRWDGAGVWLARPLRLPLLGPLRVESFLAVADSNGRVARPWFWATRASAEPLPRFSLAATRALMFGDTSGSRAIDWGELAHMVAGLNSVDPLDDPYPDNQLVAVDASWRPPTGSLPLELYFTWGAEDGSGAWWDSPLITGGIHLPALPGAPAFSLGVERTVFTGASGHFDSYRHHLLTDGWTEDDRLIGHPLGGTGREWLLYGGFDSGNGAPAVQWQAFRRLRPPGNTLAPTLGGSSWGGALQVAWFATPFRLFARAGLDATSSWRTGEAEARIEWLAGTAR